MSERGALMLADLMLRGRVTLIRQRAVPMLQMPDAPIRRVRGHCRMMMPVYVRQQPPVLKHFESSQRMRRR